MKEIIDIYEETTKYDIDFDFESWDYEFDD